MRLADVPIVGVLVRSGVEDRVFRTLLIAGPLLVAILALVGRSLATVGLAAVYLLVFVANTLNNGLRTRR